MSGLKEFFEYRFYVVFKGGFCDQSICFVGIDRDAVEAERTKYEEQAKTDDKIIRVMEITQNKRLLAWSDWTSGTAGNNFINGRAIKLGSRHVDSRCTGTKTFYCMPEDKDAAQESFIKSKKGQEAAADAYYSQPWV